MTWVTAGHTQAHTSKRVLIGGKAQIEWLRKPEEEAKVLMGGGKSEKLRNTAAAPVLQKLKSRFHPCQRTFYSTFVQKTPALTRRCLSCFQVTVTSSGDGCVEHFQGTSSAAPIAAGILALVLQVK